MLRFELAGETRQLSGSKTIRRILALVDIPEQDVKTGDLGSPSRRMISAMKVLTTLSALTLLAGIVLATTVSAALYRVRDVGEPEEEISMRDRFSSETR